ncbi:MAG: DUF1501 domain-containing protein [Bryobacteraceae bacterium]
MRPIGTATSVAINHIDRAAQTDKAVAGRLNLKARGLLDETLVIWGGEFGRSPTSDGGPGGGEGRDHNPYGFTIWMAGGGIKGGGVIGGTDELGLPLDGIPCTCTICTRPFWDCWGWNTQS